jgi:hypothetical protein
MRIGLYTNSAERIEVNFLETIVTLNVDLTDGFSIDTISVANKDVLVRTANQAYQVEGYLCDYNNVELSDVKKASVKNQGSILRVCVRPDAEARDQQVYMKYIDSFAWQRDFGGAIGIVFQPAVEDREAAGNGLTELYCISGQEVCAFETILYASMFQTPGMVSGSGIASMQFGTDPMVSRMRGLKPSSRALQEDPDVAATSEFNLDMEVIPVRNPFLDFSSSPSVLLRLSLALGISATLLSVL